MNAPVPDRMFLNSVIDRLIKGESGDWLQDAQLLVDFGLGIPSSPRIQVKSRKMSVNSALPPYATGNHSESRPNQSAALARSR